MNKTCRIYKLVGPHKIPVWVVYEEASDENGGNANWHWTLNVAESSLFMENEARSIRSYLTGDITGGISGWINEDNL